MKVKSDEDSLDDAVTGNYVKAKLASFASDLNIETDNRESKETLELELDSKHTSKEHGRRRQSMPASSHELRSSDDKHGTSNASSSTSRREPVGPVEQLKFGYLQVAKIRLSFWFGNDLRVVSKNQINDSFRAKEDTIKVEDQRQN